LRREELNLIQILKFQLNTGGMNLVYEANAEGATIALQLPLLPSHAAFQLCRRSLRRLCCSRSPLIACESPYNTSLSALNRCERCIAITGLHLQSFLTADFWSEQPS